LVVEASGVEAGLVVPAGATGVTLGYWNVWEAACMSICFLRADDRRVALAAR
jgi:hypothetical protein